MRLEDIAKKAGVSKTTASLVLNGKPGVSETKRSEILSMIQESDYVRLRKPKRENNRKPVKPRIRFVAGINEDVISLNYQQPFFNELITYITSETNNLGFSLIMSTFPKKNLLMELNHAEQEEPSAGIILLGTNLSSTLIAPISEHFKNLVILDTEAQDVDCSTITMNNFLGSYIATNHLLKMGHEKIGYIKGLPRINNFFDRRRGFKAALSKQSINAKKLPVFHMKGMSFLIPEDHTEALLNFAESVSAIFCENDYIALNVIRILQQNDFKIPEDISVIGFDDIQESAMSFPKLTTVHVPIKEIAVEAVRTITSRAQNQEPEIVHKQLFLNPSFITRDSVKKLNHV
ncbi:LacI family DNA-binding transcriptional regulator [Lactovum odontotermitis]